MLCLRPGWGGYVFNSKCILGMVACIVKRKHSLAAEERSIKDRNCNLDRVTNAAEEEAVQSVRHRGLYQVWSAFLQELKSLTPSDSSTEPLASVAVAIVVASHRRH